MMKIKSKVESNALQPTSLGATIQREINFVDLNASYCADKETDKPASIQFKEVQEVSAWDKFKQEAPWQSSNPKDSVCEKAAANLNRALFWLSCAKGEMLDNDPSKVTPGYLYQLLGKSWSPEKLATYEERIIRDFNEVFANDLELLSLKLELDNSAKKITLTMLLRDAVTGKSQASKVEGSQT